jgi:uncharacterized membrane protein
VGAAKGALAGSMSDVGIDDAFIKQVRTTSRRTSPLFVTTSNAVVDKVLDEFKETGPMLLSRNLFHEQEARPRSPMPGEVR